MKISVYGAGNQKLYLEQLKIPEKFGGEPPYGGAGMAIQFAQAGHDVVLAEPNRNIMSEDLWKKVEDARVKIVSDDIEAAKHGEVHILFTPFGKYTVKIAKNILPHVPQNAVICNTCTISPVVLHKMLAQELRAKRRDVGISSFHPAGVPGTEKQKVYVIAGKAFDGTSYATDEQINKLVELAKSINKIPKVMPMGLVSPVGDMVSSVVISIIASILEYEYSGRNYLNIPEKMIDDQVLLALTSLAALVYAGGVKELLSVIDPEALMISAENMLICEDQIMLKNALNMFKDAYEKGWINEYSKGGEIKPVNMALPLATFHMYEEIKRILGEHPAKGIVNRAIRSRFKHYLE
ncbi:coenzyme F420-dependent N(5),N(10)-methenyltetrahydromethanopterin reductase-related protein [Methanocaldococcus sp. FS406-22]|uniref:H(2)-dependent methylenetetrahydromethanopterin dehydrogenase-related protein n=1 Tax=Methanocaldococcus sp. (strain FS406-22) TaxID=644281 RepID=UPI0001C4E176|nr:H(2)-dependent methylenetetrahydromethanopterin dehydrogenase-related protein [Methanocaldococcus sp. FS406-22]ADC69633.1 coenzyme F420-dependent N(5),N(10)-methenyltetrahydromethanopterin reductase-related protein [Methanocaldococcus sp. FS406-22]